MLRRRWSRVPVAALPAAMRDRPPLVYRAVVARRRVVATARRRGGFEADARASRDPRLVAFLPEPLAPSRATRARSRTRAPPARSRARNSPRTRGRPSGLPPRPRVSPRHTPPVAAARLAPTCCAIEAPSRAPPVRTAANRAPHPQPRPIAPPADPLRCAPRRDRALSAREVAHARLARRTVASPGRRRRPTPPRCTFVRARQPATAAISTRLSGGARKTRVALRRSFSNLSQKVATVLLLLMRRRASSFSLGATETSRKKATHLVRARFPRTLDRAEAGCAWRSRGDRPRTMGNTRSHGRVKLMCVQCTRRRQWRSAVLTAGERCPHGNYGVARARRSGGGLRARQAEEGLRACAAARTARTPARTPAARRAQGAPLPRRTAREGCVSCSGRAHSAPPQAEVQLRARARRRKLKKNCACGAAPLPAWPTGRTARLKRNCAACKSARPAPPRKRKREPEIKREPRSSVSPRSSRSRSLSAATSGP